LTTKKTKQKQSSLYFKKKMENVSSFVIFC